MRNTLLPYFVRHPFKYFKRNFPNAYLLFKIVSPSIMILMIIFLVVSGLIFFSIIHPDRTGEFIDPSTYRLYAFDFIWDGAKGDTMHGWYIRGSNDAPLIALCHGYGTNRTEVLSLASLLHDNGYNVFLYNIRAHGKSPFKVCSLGYWEVKDLDLALKKLSERAEIDYKRIGIWGSSLGAYIALREAENNKFVKVLVLDSIYPSIGDLLYIKTSDILGMNSSLITFFEKFYYMIFFKTGFSTIDRTFNYKKLKDKKVLFITGRDPYSYMYAKETRTVYTLLDSEYKEILPLPDSREAILFGDEKRRYDEFVLKFFKKYLPPILEINISFSSK